MFFKVQSPCTTVLQVKYCKRAGRSGADLLRSNYGCKFVRHH